MALSYKEQIVLDDIKDNESGFLNAYHITLGYGGPEEGGWWYDVQEPLASIRFLTPTMGIGLFVVMENILKPEYEDCPRRSSMDIDAGDLIILVENEFAEYSPKERPRYE